MSVDVIIIAIFIIVVIMMISQYIDSITPKLKDILSISNTIPCDKIVVYRNGKLLRNYVWIAYINNTVQYTEFKDGILYISIN